MEPGFYSSVWGKDKRQWTETETRKVVSKWIQGKTLTPWEEGRGYTERVCYLLAWMFPGSVRIKLWETSSDLIAEPALRRMTCPTWTTLWFILGGGESLPCSVLPKAVERSFPFLQLWVQDGSDRRYDHSWTSFFLLPLRVSLSVLVPQDDVLRNHSRVRPCGLWPKVAALLEAPTPRRDVPADAASCSAQREQKKLYLDIKL